MPSRRLRWLIFVTEQSEDQQERRLRTPGLSGREQFSAITSLSSEEPVTNVFDYPNTIIHLFFDFWPMGDPFYRIRNTPPVEFSFNSAFAHCFQSHRFIALPWFWFCSVSH